MAVGTTFSILESGCLWVDAPPACRYNGWWAVDGVVLAYIFQFNSATALESRRRALNCRSSKYKLGRPGWETQL